MPLVACCSSNSALDDDVTTFLARSKDVIMTSLSYLEVQVMNCPDRALEKLAMTWSLLYARSFDQGQT